jgi:predicted ATP-dependent endonuclease of OLD family
MELFQVEITGFRKFKEKASLKTRGKLLAILGPNEAGKSSLLRALERLDDNTSFEANERSRGLNPNATTIKATYLLSAEDREAVGLTVGTWYDITKHSNGERKWTIRPTPPDRDYGHRQKLIAAVNRLTKNEQALLAEEDEQLLVDTKESFGRIFRSEKDLSEEHKQELSEIASRWREASGSDRPEKFDRIGDSLATTIRLETEESKRTVAGRALWDRLPEFLLFGEDDRDLRPSYLWTDLATSTPTALENLAKVAELDLAKLISVATTNPNDPEFDTLMERANSALERNFQAAWNQSEVAVVLAHREQSLLIQVYNNDRARTDFAQRSDGLRQFVALRCFTAARESENFILLIDEAEQHLHYDAQADLVQMLAGQTVASKVIYTTHSVGCLPEDLGNGVRLVMPVAKNSDWSKIENKFWSTREKDEAAFSPILMAMGASTMAFFPTRAAVLVEGPSDTILLPTMLREALDRTSLGVQFVHGLSEDGHVSLPLLNSTGTTVCYLLDNDGGGRKLAGQLIKRGVNPTRLFYLPKTRTDAELEDFVDSQLLAEAASNVARQHLGVDSLIASADLPKFGKWDAIIQKCQQAAVKPLEKVPVAYEVLELLYASPERRVVSKQHLASFKTLAERLLKKVQEREN